MKKSDRLIDALIIAFLLLLAFAYPAFGQANRYSPDGFSLNYWAGAGK